MAEKGKINAVKNILKSFSKVGSKSLVKLDQLDLKDPTQGFYHKDAFYHIEKGKYTETGDDRIEKIMTGFCSYDDHNHEHDHTGKCEHVYREFYFSIKIAVLPKNEDGSYG